MSKESQGKLIYFGEFNLQRELSTTQNARAFLRKQKPGTHFANFWWVEHQQKSDLFFFFFVFLHLLLYLQWLIVYIYVCMYVGMYDCVTLLYFSVLSSFFFHFIFIIMSYFFLSTTKRKMMNKWHLFRRTNTLAMKRIDRAVSICGKQCCH